MTEEDYRSIGVDPSKRKVPLISKPSPIDINSANRRVYHDDTYEDFYHNSPKPSVSSHGGNPMRYDNSSKLISPIVAKRGSSSNSSIATDMSKDSLNRPRDYYFYDSSSSYAPTGDGDDEYGYPDGSYDDGDGDDGDGKKKQYFGSVYDIENKFIVEMSKFNTKMNELYIFFKGKIKPNLKTISKQDIQDILKDMNQLDYNFTDVLHAIEDVNVFGIKNKNIRHPKIDAFKQTFETNFKKSSADIISSVKAYSSLGMYSTSSVPDNILFNSKFPTFDGKGLSFIPDSVRKNMHHSHKYLQ